MITFPGLSSGLLPSRAVFGEMSMLFGEKGKGNKGKA